MIKKYRGEGYVSRNGLPRLPKQMRDPCDALTCKQQCQSRVTEEDRQFVFKEYYSFDNAVQQWEYIAKCLGRIEPKYRRRNRGPRNLNVEYNFNLKNGREKVCKTMFLNTLVVTNSAIKAAFSKSNENGMFVGGDKRGRHIRVKT